MWLPIGPCDQLLSVEVERATEATRKVFCNVPGQLSSGKTNGGVVKTKRGSESLKREKRQKLGRHLVGIFAISTINSMAYRPPSEIEFSEVGAVLCKVSAL